MQTTSRRATRRGAVQGPTTEGGLPNLLPTDAIKIDIVCLASTRDNIIRTDLRLCVCKSGAGNRADGDILPILWKECL